MLAENIDDHDGNQTRFVVVARDGVPAPTGHDRTALVVYQRADEPGSLISILQEFAARRINLSNLISRPTKHGGLGDYCFIVFAEGHVADELLADTMRALHAKQGAVKFFGSWPRADAQAHDAREHADERWRMADDWIAEIRRASPAERPVPTARQVPSRVPRVPGRQAGRSGRAPGRSDRAADTDRTAYRPLDPRPRTRTMLDGGDPPADVVGDRARPARVTWVPSSNQS